MGGPPLRLEGIPVGHLAGFDVHAGVDRRFDEVSLTIPLAGAEIRWATDESRSVDPSSVVQRLERRIQNLDSALTDARGGPGGVAVSASERREGPAGWLRPSAAELHVSHRVPVVPAGPDVAQRSKRRLGVD